MSDTATILLTETDLAARWQVSKGALANDRSARRGVPFVKISAGRIRYRLDHIEAFELDALVLTSL